MNPRAPATPTMVNYVKPCPHCGVVFESTNEFCAEAALMTHIREDHS